MCHPRRPGVKQIQTEVSLERTSYIRGFDPTLSAPDIDLSRLVTLPLLGDPLHESARPYEGQE